MVVSDNIVSVGTPQTSGAPHVHPDGGDKKMNGVVYVVFGDLAAGTTDLVTEADAYILRNDGADSFQVSGIAIGDMSGDSKSDLVLGVQKEDNPSLSLGNAAGAVYIINGGSEFPVAKVVNIDTGKGHGDIWRLAG
ncbi:MAG: hypothetical protein B6245_20215 [Desulfobacteraceae bacterium 4572_88]|nr:MAG: hypothetical protein B6245_20215 [Desulfobacteraceae bacterium 4572_88]RLC15162.1 MAG: hypothetical protein DRI57_13295 [Deltaproteobacteria bacterium]